jgi:hypothetical protein
MKCSQLTLIASLTLLHPLATVAQTRADTREVVDALIYVCVGGGSEEKLEAEGKLDVALTLKKLRSGDIGGSGGIAAKYSKAEWQGLMGGINSQMTPLQADQADKVRECLKPYMPGIVRAILERRDSFYRQATAGSSCVHHDRFGSEAERLTASRCFPLHPRKPT